MFKLLPLTFIFALLTGCAAPDQLASERALYQHNLEARNYCKAINEDNLSYQCFDEYMLNSPSVTQRKLLTIKQSLQQAKQQS
ncbi:hypothetical protein [Vibrio methylphosphonaticus]|uniref:hypothetical protein n=1 Tax=Vibrio methylphosphonaticus TaxID=2946866 RepID=UPI00202AB440|nr:hypothetical protein [Vibrio methylphosphonaticus]MCL9776758.1 hypothetical protein [Vibrio methylphosphonaticus]